MAEQIQTLLRRLPSVDTVTQQVRQDAESAGVGPAILVKLVRERIDSYRQALLAGKAGQTDEPAAAIAAEVRRDIQALSEPFYRRAINATGIVLHTGLGRAVLPQAALKQIQDHLGGYSLLQVDIKEGKRSNRDGRIEQLLRLLTGAEAATVVNNNSAATAIVLNTVGAGKEVIVSRGQLVEIGGSFRLPEVMAFSGAKLVEVGTTNKTHPRDYENAITENTAAILRVHPSNYKIMGFTEEVPLGTMVSIAHSHNLPLIDDVGAGSLIDFSRFGFEPEPTLLDSIQQGADIVTSSGDKLIGASQAGIILGKADWIAKIRKNQFARIVRVDKFTLTALEATLTLFLDEKTAFHNVPTLQMMLRKPDELEKQARRIADALSKALPHAAIVVLPGFSQTGSGSLPTQNLPTTLVGISSPAMTAMTLANRLRLYSTPIFTRIQNEQILIDPRTLRDDDEAVLIEALASILARETRQ
ncbi:L-seryl-tRNA(Sec) selenium transferase [Anaerohalosphaeraceae bacterium U12dextr]